MLNRLLGALGRALIFTGIVVLLFVVYQLWGTSFDESQHQDQLAHAFASKVGVGGPSKFADNDPSVVIAEVTDRLEQVDPATAPATAPPKEGDPGGFIEIPKIGLTNRVFVENIAKADLRKGPGHYPGTPMPGNPGNAAIAGHRTTYGAPFNRLDELQPGDKIKILTPQGRFVYEVMASPAERRQGAKDATWGDGWFAVRPNDVSVIAPTDDNRLTLTACHPKYSARLRIVVQAKLVNDPAAAPATTTTIAKAASGGSATPSQPADLISGDSGQLGPALLYGGIVVAIWLVAAALAALLRKRSFRWWPVYAIAVIASAPALWICFTHLDKFLTSY